VATEDDPTPRELLTSIVDAGVRVFDQGQTKLADADLIYDDERWPWGFPLRHELQLRFLLLGALDVYEVTANAIRARATLQVFSTIRHLSETLVLVKWMCEPASDDDRQRLAYGVLKSQLPRWAKMLREDAADDPDAMEVVAEAEQMLADLSLLAEEDGVGEIPALPGRRELYTEYFPIAGYGAFALQSELGSHPGPIAHLLFVEHREAGRVVDVGAAWEERTFWSSVMGMLLGQVLEAVARCLGWTEWFETAVRPIIEESALLWAQALERYRASRN
jgi:hypothetical protein